MTCYGAIIAIPTTNVSRIDNGLKNADDLLRGIFSHMGNVGLRVTALVWAIITRRKANPNLGQELD